MSYPDLSTAVQARLRTSTTLVALLNERKDLAGGTRIWIDIADERPLFPWIVIIQMGEDTNFQSADGNGDIRYYCDGSLQLSIFGVSTSQVSQIIRLTISVLTDSPLVFDDGGLLELRVASYSSSGEYELTPRKQLVYHGYVEFQYMIERTL